LKSVIPDDRPDRCYICGRYGQMEIHHMLHGIRRKAADKYGLTVHICPLHHRLLHDKGFYDEELEQVAQRTFEETHSHEEFMQIFGKNYL